MPRYRRLRIPGACYFFTVNLADRGSRLLVERIDDLRAAWAETLLAAPVVCDAVVILPDHLHAVWTLPPGDSGYSARWGAIKARFTMRLRRAGRGPGFSPAPLPKEFPRVGSGRYAGLKPGLRADKREAAIWQRRFWEHTIRDEADYRAHVAYCWGNPVKHGLVERAADWPFSSLHRDIRLGRADPEWSGGLFDGTFGEQENA